MRIWVVFVTRGDVAPEDDERRTLCAYASERRARLHASLAQGIADKAEDLLNEGELAADPYSVVVRFESPYDDDACLEDGVAPEYHVECTELHEEGS